MDFGKVDAPLAAALDRASENDRLEVSIRTKGPLDEKTCRELGDLGARGVVPGRTIFSAEISPAAARLLTDKSWIQRLSLAQPLRPLDLLKR